MKTKELGDIGRVHVWILYLVSFNTTSGVPVIVEIILHSVSQGFRELVDMHEIHQFSLTSYKLRFLLIDSLNDVGDVTKDCSVHNSCGMSKSEC